MDSTISPVIDIDWDQFLSYNLVVICYCITNDRNWKSDWMHFNCIDKARCKYIKSCLINMSKSNKLHV